MSRQLSEDEIDEAIESDTNREHPNEESAPMEKYELDIFADDEILCRTNATENKNQEHPAEKEAFQEEAIEDHLADMISQRDLEGNTDEKIPQTQEEQPQQKPSQANEKRNSPKNSSQPQSIENKKQRKYLNREAKTPPAKQTRIIPPPKDRAQREPLPNLFKITEASPSKIYPVDIKVKKMRPRLARLAFFYSPLYANEHRSQMSERTYLVGMEKSLLSVEVTGKELLKPDFDKDKFYELEKLNLEEINDHSGISINKPPQQKLPIDSTISEEKRPKFLVETKLDPKSGNSTHRSPSPIDKLKLQIREKAFGAMEMLELQSRTSSTNTARKLPLRKQSQLDSINQGTLKPLDISAYYTSLDEHSIESARPRENIQSHFRTLDGRGKPRTDLALKVKEERNFPKIRATRIPKTPSFSSDNENNTLEQHNSSSHSNNSKNLPEKPAKIYKSPYETPVIPKELLNGDSNLLANLNRGQQRNLSPFLSQSPNVQHNVLDYVEISRGRSVPQKKDNVNQKFTFKNTKLPSIFTSNSKYSIGVNRVSNPKNQSEIPRFSSVPKQRIAPMEN